jgi:hypothetical protein
VSESDVMFILAGLAMVVLATLLLRFAKQIGFFLLIAGGVVAVVAIALALTAQAEANRQAAQAMKMASASQTASSVGITVLAILLVLVILIGGGAVLYFYVRMRQAESQPGSRGWAPGPNAKWQRKGDPGFLPPAAYGPSAAQLFGQMQIQNQFMMTMMIECMQFMRELRGRPRMRQSFLPEHAPLIQGQLAPGDDWWPDGFDE